MSSLTSGATGDGISVASYQGDGAVLLAFDLPENRTKDLAGFSIHCTAPTSGPYPTNEYWLKNRLSISGDGADLRGFNSDNFVESDQAPFQSFHWVHFPSAGPGVYTYDVYASYFTDGRIRLGQKASVKVDLSGRSFPGLELGFTRSYISSQAYVDRFSNKPIRPAKKSIDFDTTPYQSQYEWLGAHARQIIFNFLDECKKDNSISLDVFSYDLDEPDIISALSSIGSRLRLFQDDSRLHTGPNAMEPKAVAQLRGAGAQVETGHFKRFAHDKVMILKKNGNPLKVLTGSANFSVRGLYVQANSVLEFDSQEVATLYEKAFDQAFSSENQFASSQIAAQWINPNAKDIPSASFSFAPHLQPFTLDGVSEAIQSAESSVFFAIMQTGSGPVFTDLEELGSKKDLLSLGTIESEGQVKLFKPGTSANSAITSYAFLEKNVPEPFKEEWRGGPGQVIHHKFVVCDFNGKNPAVFCGSSNLAAGGEVSNGDNLIGIRDPRIAIYYAVEAIRLFDHFRFRSLQESAVADSKPLSLDSTDNWALPYYDPSNIKSRERILLSSSKPVKEVPA